MILATSFALLLCVLIVIYPYAIYPLILKLLPKRPVARDPAHRCSATLVFCAYNEGAAMPEKLRNIEGLKRRYPELEVLAFDDGSADDTAAQILARPDLVTLVQGGGRSGKANGMKRLAAMASGDIMIFTDANVLLDEDAIDNLMAWYADPEVGGICGTLQYLGSEDSTTASVGGLYWRLEERIKTRESCTGNVMGADGSIFSLRRTLYPDFPDTVLDDLTVSMAAVFAGKRLLKVDDVIAYERLVAARGEEFSRKVRIAARAYHTHMYLRPQLASMATVDKFKYVSRKLVRWFGGFFLILGALVAVILSALISPLLGGAAVAVLGLAILLGPKVEKGPVAAVAEIVLALIATLMGVLRAMRGQTFVTWSPAKSR
ncbi:Glycosyltransferase, catalytic subunit of cellulose synthase and poly-beta-1,6-N-acetylglucosamine synthase [Salipiger thiooxidans]|uniref:Glycosyltransferase, catalytic subunit of cellulose synthase and poly-beta-1,6-N-acetylglucosamine synthase n=1 Tax=Salipiger thiooxidans TaxID=282683 RepID=A0A1G7LLB9_9RHOB|nr:glycosyltransferase [Salipiger thiooxidans]SDF50275.1 Glycosyltransferase, catalytic subunit of cellulose synthase and poly-beta-1,6-N-acetylglucosamine synthase [Salipiger thiooxidans]